MKWGQSCRALKAVLRTLAFPLREMGASWCCELETGRDDFAVASSLRTWRIGGGWGVGALMWLVCLGVFLLLFISCSDFTFRFESIHILFLRLFARYYILMLQKTAVPKAHHEKSLLHCVPVGPLGCPLSPFSWPCWRTVAVTLLFPSWLLGSPCASPRGQTKHPHPPTLPPCPPDLKHFLPCSLGGQTTLLSVRGCPRPWEPPAFPSPPFPCLGSPHCPPNHQSKQAKRARDQEGGGR